MKDDHTLQADPVIAVAIGGASLMVRADDAEAVGLLMVERFGEPDLEKVRRLNAKVKRKVYWWFVKGALGLLGLAITFDRRFFQPENLLSTLIFLGITVLAFLLVYFFFIRSPDIDFDIDDEEEPAEPVDEEEPDWVNDIDWGDDPQEDEQEADVGFGWADAGSDSSDGDGGD